MRGCGLPNNSSTRQVGQVYLADGKCEFTVWAPFVKEVSLKVLSAPVRLVPMEIGAGGYWTAKVEGLAPDSLYFFQLGDGLQRPDPASHFQPEGVHGPSQVIDHNSFVWDDVSWNGLELSRMIMYEAHTGAFTPDGTFDAIISRLDDLKDTGINALELMPVAQFPGERNWGYDGVYLFSVQNSYGGPYGLKRLVNECHKKGLAVILDVVYNHFGPEGNYLWDYGAYFTAKYKTPWGDAVNFDGEYSDHVKNFFVENALHWFRNYHIDALRLDAVHGITDMGARPFLRELADRTAEFSREKGRKFYLIAESDLNDSKLIRPPEQGGYGLDAQWCDDFHHSLHTLLTGETGGYYCDFGKISDLVKALKEGYVYSGGYSAFRKRRHGNSAKDRPADKFIVSSQNHDQVGNKMFGERLSSLVPFESLKLAAGVVLLSPYMPLLFMGEEYGEDAPFLYFVSHTDAGLVESVRKGRKEEFRDLVGKGEPPDPQDPETFYRSKLQWDRRSKGYGKILLGLYKTLIKIRTENPALSRLDRACLEVTGLEEKKVMFLRRWSGDRKDSVFCFFNFSKEHSGITVPSSLEPDRWRKNLVSSDVIWGGGGPSLPDIVTAGDEITLSPLSFAVYSKIRTEAGT